MIFIILENNTQKIVIILLNLFEKHNNILRMFVISSFEVKMTQKWNHNMWVTSKKDSKMTLKTKITKLIEAPKMRM